VACCLWREEAAVEEEETEEAYDLGVVIAESLGALEVVEEVSLEIKLLSVVRIILNVV
jgi:hypothetical protein